MAKRDVLEEGEKKKFNKANLGKLVGVFRFMSPYKRTFIVGLISLVLSSFTLMSFPFLIGKAIDVAQGKTGFPLTTIPQINLALFVILFLQAVFSFTRVYTFSIVSEWTLADLRHSLYKKMIWLPQTFFDSRRTGELISRITSDVSVLQDTFTVVVAEFSRQILVLVIGTIVILIITPKLTVFMLLTFPVLVLAALFFGKFIRKLSKNTQDQLASANVIVEETFQSIVVVKSFTNELFEVLRYRKSLNEVVKTALHAGWYRSFFISFVIFTLFGGIIAVSWYGEELVRHNALSVGDLLSFVIYTFLIGGSVAGLGDIFTQLQRSIGASERLLEILALEDESSTSKGTLKLSGWIRFNNVNFSYPSRADLPVLRGIDFNIAPGEKIALVGPSGSGKSTIINLLMRFYPLPSGSIMADEKDILDYELSDYRRNIGIVPQEVILFGGSIRENIGYGKPDATELEIIDAARKANALEFIMSFPDKFNTLVGDRGIKLSGGQRQRVAIARAILKDPAILILDEATSALDSASERLVQEALEKLMENRTTIIIAHRLSTIRKADRILVIKEGTIAEAGSHHDLILVENGIYSNLLKMQLEIN